MRTNDENGTRREAVPHPARLPARGARFLAGTGKRRRPLARRPRSVLERIAAVSATGRPDFDAVDRAAPARMEPARKPVLRMEASVR
jgi:hypothetical protein